MNKKVSLSLLAAAMALVAGASAFAQTPTATLKVTGTMAVPGCNVAQSGGGIYNYGNISPDMIKAGAATTLQDQTQTWTVTCDANTFLSFRVIDNQASSTAGSPSSQFGLGNINGNGKIGYYTVAGSNPVVDGMPVYFYAAKPGAGTGVRPGTLLGIETDLNMGWAASAQSSNPPQQAGRVFTMDLTVTPTLASTATMGGPVVERVPLDGLLTINYSFGL